MTTQTRDALAERPENEELARRSATRQLPKDEDYDTDADAAEDETNEGDEEMSAEDFEALLNESEDRTRMRVNVGQRVDGRVVALSSQVVYVDIGMRSEAALPVTEDPRFASLVEGEVISVYVANPNGQVEVSLDPILGKGDISLLEEAFNGGAEIEGKITAQINGGFEVNVSGVRCFCPHSQISGRGATNTAELVGQVLAFKVIDLDVRKKNVVLSRRAILDAERKKAAEATRDRLQVGAVLTGVVRDIQRFGAFVDLGGVQGLLHISQLSYENVDRVETVLTVGEEVQVKVLEIATDARGKERISLSMKALQVNPWEDLGFTEGQTIIGTVARKSQFGVFMNLAPAIDGLLPRRMMKRSGQNIGLDHFNEGDQVEVVVIEVNHDDRKIALALPGWDEEVKSTLREGDVLLAEVIKILPVGVLVKGVEDPARGLLHKRHLKQSSPRQIAEAFAVGSQHNVMLAEVDAQGRYNFVLPPAPEEVDHRTISEFSNKEGLGHSPFASFFKDRD